MTKVIDKSADNQSEARISVAYNKNCHLSLMTSFVKRPPDLEVSHVKSSIKKSYLEVIVAVFVLLFPWGSIHLEIVAVTILVVQEIIFVHADAVTIVTRGSTLLKASDER